MELAEEVDMSSVWRGLPSEAAFLLLQEPLEKTLISAFLTKHVPLPSLNELQRAAHEVSLALACLAQQGVVHADLKPENVMLASDGRAVIIDYGKSRLLPPAYASSVLPLWLGSDSSLRRS